MIYSKLARRLPLVGSFSRRQVAKHIPYLLRFGAVGGLGVLVNYAVLYGLVEFGRINQLVAVAFATETAIFSNFVLNNLWTFRDRRSSASLVRRALRYNLFALGGLIISVVVLAALTYLLGLHYLEANAFAIGAATLWNYATNYRWTWSSPADDPTRDLEV